jgi:hypothetical protein
MIGLIKKQLWQTFEGKKHSHEETLILLIETVQSINSRPITRNPRPEGEPLCVQDLMLGRAQPGVTRPEEPVPSPTEETKAMEVEERLPIENSHGSKPQPKGKVQGKPTLAIKCKKVSSLKKAGEQTRTIVVTVPMEEEEMVDVRAVKRKRGRPRKVPGTEPLDQRECSGPR